MGEPARVQVVEHPLVQHKVAYLRNAGTGVKEFRELVSELSMLLAYEVTRKMPLTPVSVRTPLEATQCHVVSGKKVAVVAILRAGLGMVDGILRLVPMAKVGHIGLYRDPDTLKPQEYYCNLPGDLAEREVLLVDPMLATGGSMVRALDLLEKHGAGAIKVVCIIAAPEGVAVVEQRHPDVEIFTAALDRELNSHGYILPGLGDAGDRLFGTK
ncbi:MAG: uracil phosphoribosyltransferase [Bacillota bacterium]|jgi:uracil phosphoribosyltransferase